MATLVDYFGNSVTSEKAVTAGYSSPPRSLWGQQPRDLPLFTFYIIEHMLLDQTIRLGLAMRSAPIVSAEFAYKEKSGEWTPGVRADKPAVAQFVERQLERIWTHDIYKLLDAQIWGWAAAEVMYKIRTHDDGTKHIEFDKLLERHARDCQALEFQETGGFAGVAIGGGEDGEVNLGKGKSIWLSYNSENGSHYGRSALRGPYSAWADKWLDGGALDVRKLFMHGDAYGGRRMQYPPGLSTAM